MHTARTYCQRMSEFQVLQVRWTRTLCTGVQRRELYCVLEEKNLCVCNRAEDDDKEDAGDSIDLYAEVGETQISSGEDGGDEWCELEGILEEGGSGKSSRKRNNARAGMDNEMSTSGGGGDKRDESKNKRERGLRKEGVTAGVQGGTDDCAGDYLGGHNRHNRDKRDGLKCA